MQTIQRLTALFLLPLALGVVLAQAQTSSRTVIYHAQDIVPIRAKVKYTTLIIVPPSEKIMEAATGDKDFWIVDVVGNFCFVHPAKPGISSNLNLITDKGNIYSFTLTDVSGEPDLKVIIQPADLRTSWPPMAPHSMFQRPSSTRRASRSPACNRAPAASWTSTNPPIRSI